MILLGSSVSGTGDLRGIPGWNLMLSLWPGSPPWWGCLHHALGHWCQGSNLQVGNPLRVKSVKGRTVPVRWITGWGCHCPPTISPSHPTPAQMLAIIPPDSIHVKLCWGAKKASSGYPRAVQCQKFGNCVSLDNSFLWLNNGQRLTIFLVLWLLSVFPKGSSFSLSFSDVFVVPLSPPHSMLPFLAG